MQVKLTQRESVDREIPAAAREGVALSLGISPGPFGTSRAPSNPSPYCCVHAGSQWTARDRAFPGLFFLRLWTSTFDLILVLHFTRQEPRLDNCFSGFLCSFPVVSFLKPVCYTFPLRLCVQHCASGSVVSF